MDNNSNDEDKGRQSCADIEFRRGYSSPVVIPDDATDGPLAEGSDLDTPRTAAARQLDGQLTPAPSKDGSFRSLEPVPLARLGDHDLSEPVHFRGISDATSQRPEPGSGPRGLPSGQPSNDTSPPDDVGLEVAEGEDGYSGESTDSGLPGPAFGDPSSYDPDHLQKGIGIVMNRKNKRSAVDEDMEEMVRQVTDRMHALQIDWQPENMGRRTCIGYCGNHRKIRGSAAEAIQSSFDQYPDDSTIQPNCFDKLADWNYKYVRSDAFDLIFFASLGLWSCGFLWPTFFSTCTQFSVYDARFDPYADACAALVDPELVPAINLPENNNRRADFCGNNNTPVGSTCAGPKLWPGAQCVAAAENGPWDDTVYCRDTYQVPDAPLQGGALGPFEATHQVSTVQACLADARCKWDRGESWCACAWRPDTVYGASWLSPIVSWAITLYLMTPMFMSVFVKRLKCIMRTFEFWFKSLYAIGFVVFIFWTSIWELPGQFGQFFVAGSFALLLAAQDALPLRVPTQFVFGFCGVVGFSIWLLACIMNGFIDWMDMDLNLFFINTSMRTFMYGASFNLILFFGRQGYRGIAYHTRASTIRTYIPLDRGFTTEKHSMGISERTHQIIEDAHERKKQRDRTRRNNTMLGDDEGRASGNTLRSSATTRDVRGLEKLLSARSKKNLASLFAEVTRETNTDSVAATPRQEEEPVQTQDTLARPPRAKRFKSPHGGSSPGPSGARSMVPTRRSSQESEATSATTGEPGTPSAEASRREASSGGVDN